MNAFAKRSTRVSDELVDAERVYMNVYDELNDMVETGLLTRDEYNRIMIPYFDTGDELLEGIRRILDILDELEEQKSDHSEEVQK